MEEKWDLTKSMYNNDFNTWEELDTYQGLVNIVIDRARHIDSTIGKVGTLPSPPTWNSIRQLIDDPQYSEFRQLYTGHLQLTNKHPTMICKAVSGDGNCFYNAISLHLYGHEQASPALRLRALLEYLIHPKPTYRAAQLITPLMQNTGDHIRAKLAYRMATVGQWTPTEIAGLLSSALNIAIHIFQPGMVIRIPCWEQMSFHPCLPDIMPRDSHRHIILGWTSYGKPTIYINPETKAKEVNPTCLNHFVPIYSSQPSALLAHIKSKTRFNEDWPLTTAELEARATHRARSRHPISREAW